MVIGREGAPEEAPAGVPAGVAALAAEAAAVHVPPCKSPSRGSSCTCAPCKSPPGAAAVNAWELEEAPPGEGLVPPRPAGPSCKPSQFALLLELRILAIFR